MPSQVLVPVDGSPLSKKALEVAVTDYPDAAVTVLHVMDPIGSGFSIIDVMRPDFRHGKPPGSVTPEYWDEWYQQSHAKAQTVFDEARDVVESYDAEIETVLEFGKPEQIIVEYAENHDVDRIVMGSHGRSGTMRVLLGSVTESVLQHSPVPVLVVR